MWLFRRNLGHNNFAKTFCQKMETWKLKLPKWKFNCFWYDKELCTGKIRKWVPDNFDKHRTLYDTWYIPNILSYIYKISQSGKISENEVFLLHFWVSSSRQNSIYQNGPRHDWGMHRDTTVHGKAMTYFIFRSPRMWTILMVYISN